MKNLPLPMRRTRWHALPAVGALTFALALALSGCGERATKPADARSTDVKNGGKEGEPGSGGLKLSAEEAQRAGIKLEALALQSVADTLTVTATIRPNQNRIARIAPRVEGRIVQVAANLGDEVKPGQALAVLDSIALGEAQSSLQLAQSTRRVAQADFQRAESLIADEIIPRRDYLRAKADLEKASAELRAAESKLRLLGGSAKVSGGSDSTFPLTSPLAGTVIQKKATVGELATPSEPLFTVADLSTLWVEANLTEDSLAKVRAGAAATVTVGAYAGERFPGRVAYIASVLDKDSRTVSARVEVPNKDRRLKPEMFASVTIDLGAARREALSVPDEAVVLLQGQPTVFVAKEGGYEARAIEPGEKLAGRTVVKSGVVAGEQVVTAGVYALKARTLKSQIGGAD